MSSRPMCTPSPFSPQYSITQFLSTGRWEWSDGKPNKVGAALADRTCTAAMSGVAGLLARYRHTRLPRSSASRPSSTGRSASTLSLSHSSCRISFTCQWRRVHLSIKGGLQAFRTPWWQVSAWVHDMIANNASGKCTSHQVCGMCERRPHLQLAEGGERRQRREAVVGHVQDLQRRQRLKALSAQHSTALRTMSWSVLTCTDNRRPAGMTSSSGAPCCGREMPHSRNATIATRRAVPRTEHTTMRGTSSEATTDCDLAEAVGIAFAKTRLQGSDAIVAEVQLLQRGAGGKARHRLQPVAQQRQPPQVGQPAIFLGFQSFCLVHFPSVLVADIMSPRAPQCARL